MHCAEFIQLSVSCAIDKAMDRHLFPIGFDKRHFIASAAMLAVRLEEFASMSTKLSTEGIIDTQTKLIESDRPASLLP